MYNSLVVTASTMHIINTRQKLINITEREQRSSQTNNSLKGMKGGIEEKEQKKYKLLTLAIIIVVCISR